MWIGQPSFQARTEHRLVIEWGFWKTFLAKWIRRNMKGVTCAKENVLGAQLWHMYTVFCVTQLLQLGLFSSILSPGSDSKPSSRCLLAGCSAIGLLKSVSLKTVMGLWLMDAAFCWAELSPTSTVSSTSTTPRISTSFWTLLTTCNADCCWYNLETAVYYIDLYDKF